MSVAFSRSRIRPTPKLSASHQQAEPENTPSTRAMGESVLPISMVPAKIAAKKRMVRGFVIVRKKWKGMRQNIHFALLEQHDRLVFQENFNAQI